MWSILVDEVVEIDEQVPEIRDLFLSLRSQRQRWYPQ